MRVIGIAGWSGSGKTTLIERLVPRLTALGKTVATVKHAHHGFDLDTPGKDSWRHRQAGASRVLLLSGERWVLMSELRGAPEPDWATQWSLLAPSDFVLVEGFKAAPIPKLEVHRPALGKPPIWPQEPAICAVAVPGGLLPGCDRPVVDLDDTDALLTVVLRYAVAVENAQGSRQETEEMVCP